MLERSILDVEQNSRSSPICPLCSHAGRFFYAELQPAKHYATCPQCALVWLAPEERLSLIDERAHYEQHRNSPQDLNYRAFLARLWTPLSRQLKQGAQGLDYGSGPGATLHQMANEAGFECKHYDPYFHPDTSVLSASYDFITCSEVAEHFHQPELEFERLANCLNSGAWLGVMTSLYDGLDSFADWHYRIDPTHVCFYTQRSFEYIRERWGFATIQLYGDSVVLLKKS